MIEWKHGAKRGCMFLIHNLLPVNDFYRSADQVLCVGWVKRTKKKACLLSSFEDKVPCLIRHLQPDWTRFWKTFFVNIRGECNLQSRISPPFSSGQSGRFKDRIKGGCVQTNSSWTLPLTRINSTGHWPIGFDEQLVLF